MAGLRLWRNTRVATLADGETATLGVRTLGYEWGEALENGFQPAGLVRLSSTTIAERGEDHRLRRARRHRHRRRTA